MDTITLALAKAYVEEQLANGGVAQDTPEQVQSNWDQNDESAVDFIKNKPFGDVIEWNAVFENAELFKYENNEYAVNTLTGELPSGNIFRVVYNGAEYLFENVDWYSGVGDEELTDYPFWITQTKGILIRAKNVTDSISLYKGTTSLKQIDEVYIPSTIARTEDVPDAQVQADLSQTDDTQLNYIKGVLQQRHLPEGYPYEETTEGVLVEETSIEFTAQAVQNPFSLEIVEGQTCCVTWDGTEYECVCVILSGAYYIGNLSIFGQGDDTGEPFLIGLLEGGDTTAIAVFETDIGTHTISISFENRIAVPMDEKFLPDVGNSMLVIIEDDDTTSELKANKTYQEILDAVASGHHVYAVY